MAVQNGGGDGSGSGAASVVVNVYDLTPMNNYLYWFGLGIFHSGIEVHGVEYGFGAHEFPTSGVFEVEPKNCPGFVYRRSVRMGTTGMSRAEFRSFIEKLTGKYNDDVSKNLTGKPIPGWVNRLARVGSFFNYLLPKSIQVSAVRHVPTHPAFSVALSC
uniref:OSJNBa0065H10.7 protein n=1 Tax=Oryza sativa subsp. japonica TaxID=39947 RepID=Q5CAG0_ORYSJ|nr:OSJNBa0065H10.7 [Oryza sativa Japonica Group]